MALLAELRPIIDQRPTYGYHRVTALLNRQRRREGKPTVNTKRVLRVMQQYGLTLQKHPALRSTPTTTASSSPCSPISADVQIISKSTPAMTSWSASSSSSTLVTGKLSPWSAVANAGISGEMVCDLMIAAVERRYQALKVAHRLEWLSDNGSAYVARQTAQGSAALGIDLLFTPVRSPQSNGMSEAFVKTLKRDYASTAILPDAETILTLLPE